MTPVHQSVEGSFPFVVSCKRTRIIEVQVPSGDLDPRRVFSLSSDSLQLGMFRKLRQGKGGGECGDPLLTLPRGYYLRALFTEMSLRDALTPETRVYSDLAEY